MDRYTEISRSDERVWGDRCPVLAERWCIWRDNETGTATGQVQILSLVMPRVIGVTVHLECFGAAGEALEGRDYRIEGTGLRFGMETALPLPDPNTAKLLPIVTSVSFSDGSIWYATGGQWGIVPHPEQLSAYLPDLELQREYRDAVGRPCFNAPSLWGELFQCVCGGTTLGHQCRDCGRTYEALAGALDPNYLQHLIGQRQYAAAMEAEKQRKAEEKKVRRKAARKTFLVALVVVLVLGALGILTPTVILPRIQNGQSYSAAMSALEEGRYDEAHAGFLALGDYKDSQEMALETRYIQAQELYENGRFAEAITIFETLGDYRDADKEAEAVQDAWNEHDYQAALSLVDAGAFPAAAAAFEALGDYKDSAQWVIECQMLQRDYDYKQALSVMESGDYMAARELFLALGEYLDSQDKAAECFAAQQALDYASAMDAMEAKDYAAALPLLEKLGEAYEDVAQQLLVAHYNLGLECLAAEEFEEAVEHLSYCGNYQQTPWNLNLAKMGYARTHQDRNDAKTLEYLKELKAIYFQDSLTLYNELFGWKVEVTAFSNDSKGTPQDTISKYGNMYVHFKVTGGEPGAKFTLRVQVTPPGSNKNTMYYEDISSGFSGYAYVWYYDPDRAPTGMLIFQAYDESNRLLCSASVQVTR